MFRDKKYRKRRVIVSIGVFILSFFIWVYWIAGQEYGRFPLGQAIYEMGVKLKVFLIPKMEEYDFSLIEGINKQLEEENTELKKILELNIENYSEIHASVISRDLDWYQEITIDKGKKDGIREDMAVVSNQGLIGRVIQVGSSVSVIKLLTSNSTDMKIAVDIKAEEGNVHGIINGYLESDSCIQVDNIPKNHNINIGDKVYTNGLGGIYPSGIYIGKIADISYDSLGLNKIAKVKADFSYDTLRYVTIIDRGEKK